MRIHIKIRIVIVTLALLCAVLAQAAEDSLPSWNDTPTKRAIIDFVTKVTDENGNSYIPAGDRIATLDNDGTLWTEKPLYTHFYGVLAQMKAQMAGDPFLHTREPYRSVAKKDFNYFMELYENSAFASLAGQLFAVPFGGYTDVQYDGWFRTFISEFKHPKFGVGVEGLIYQPMVELIRYLEASGFAVYIFTADEAAFLRLVAEDLYGLPPERVQGTSVRSEFIIQEEKPVLVRSYRIQHLNNWDGKPRLIQSVIGKKPVFAAGNSNGDQHMLQYAALSGGMSILIHHTDAEREFAYDSHTDKVMPLAKKEGWTVVDMKRDWKLVFPQHSE
jgi:soluble P-type ATPase